MRLQWKVQAFRVVGGSSLHTLSRMVVVPLESYFHCPAICD